MHSSVAWKKGSAIVVEIGRNCQPDFAEIGFFMHSIPR
jgi:hypothetical protein